MVLNTGPHYSKRSVKANHGVFSGPYFPVFGLNTDIYGVNIRIQSEYRKIRTRRNSVFGHFSRGYKIDHGPPCMYHVCIGSLQFDKYIMLSSGKSWIFGYRLL